MKDYMKSTDLAFLPSSEINHYFQHNRYPKLPSSWILKPKKGQQGGDCLIRCGFPSDSFLFHSLFFLFCFFFSAGRLPSFIFSSSV
jgi:hypothetical protein